MRLASAMVSIALAHFMNLYPKKKFNSIRARLFLLIIVVVIGLLLSLLSNTAWNNPALPYKTLKENVFSDIKRNSAFIDSSGYLRSILSPKFRWCSANPFLKFYNQTVVLDLELQWISWKSRQLLTAYKILKNYALHIGDWNGGMVNLVYPPALPLPCPHPSSLTRFGGTSDGGKLICGAEILKSPTKCTVYSLGSFGNFKFELDLLKRTSCKIHTYDCTSAPPASKDRMTFHKICLGDASNLQQYMYPYKTRKAIYKFKNGSLFKLMTEILKENKQNEVHILKMDIEGGEYSVFSDLLCQTDETILPYQISFESHWWNRDIYHAILHQKMFSQIWEAGYRIVQHEYNSGDHACVEWTLMRVFC